ncbi:hypothetical protein ABFS82_06G150800 [Erythranthe guttata]|uniref:3-oxo-5-alpha-steroid 4-dehydrogenase C-terminal domain-containing protein n=1 Tax=Erythranthe guttata TaxID=4155 RepID=A0A022QWW4_ERYGU|nr:PREDICTED: 3-oxo-5-alpha-steroid 4-dehydrogenase 2-like [Erythranthe guttata]EYU33152.1 hypothetical protein MIMGU_mgv1a011719mg [Erythranthe guttata]|eukprot:XP_012842445.1 PREDICTED: 3-oxo-5-alpha-steroid 4-dehydrogenase 2-like [Erythranthe guttata]
MMMMIGEIVGGCVYEEHSSFSEQAFYAVTLLWLLFLCTTEIIGNHLQYSKFWNSTSSNKSKLQIMLSSKIGMLILYTPALLAAASSFALLPNGGGGIRFPMLKSALTIHFLKRDLETLFIHKYSGFVALESAVFISATYFTMAAGTLYFQHQTRNFPEPSTDLKYIGVLLFTVGICGNFYHHYFLSKLRNKSDKGYKIPTGGLFGLVICPHYLFEIITFIGISFISQTLFMYLCAVGSTFYLIPRSFATRKWYVSKFENFPKNVKALIPYVL